MAGAPRTWEEDPTEELPIDGEPYAEWVFRRQIAIERLTRAVESHRRSADSGAVAITAADRKLYERVDRLRQPG